MSTNPNRIEIINLVDSSSDEDIVQIEDSPITCPDLNATHLPRHIPFISPHPLVWSHDSSSFQITRNLRAEIVDIKTSLPFFFPSHENGYATFIDLTSSQIQSIRGQYDQQNFLNLIHDTSYSIRFKSTRETTVYVDSASFPVIRRTGKCTGVKSCAHSVRSASIHHQGIVTDDHSDQHTDSECEGSGGASFVNDEFELARQVFFYAQNTFPINCKHNGSTSGKQPNDYVKKQRRTPNWVFHTGKLMNSPTLGPTQRPDFIGCADFGKPGLKDSRRCDLRTLPSHLQHANSSYIDELVLQAMRGNFPEVPPQVTDTCPPLPRNHSGKHCDRHVHGFEAVPLKTISCSVSYHFLVHFNGGEPLWLIVIGIGIHKHRAPLRRPAHISVANSVREIHENNPLVTMKQLQERILVSCEVAPPIATLRNEHQLLKKKTSPYGQSISSLIQKQTDLFDSGDPSYISHVIDDREADKTRQKSDQVGIVILLCNENLLRRCVSSPTFGVDGTFNMVARCSEKVTYELVSIVSKDHATGTSFSVMRQLASRKTVASRKVLFDFFLRKLKDLGLPDPMQAPPTSRLAVSSDFETTFGIALGQSLCDIYRPGSPMTDNWQSYVTLVCYGCDVHAKRIILDKLNRDEDNLVFSWAVGTRRLTHPNDIRSSLRTMQNMGDKWKTFSIWLSTNIVANILWFQSFYKNLSSSNTTIPTRVMWTTNANEAMHSRIKGMAEYRVTNSRGLPLFDLVTMLERVESEDFMNISGSRGYQYNSTPLWRRQERRGTKRSSDGMVLLNGVSVSASEPKNRRRKYNI